MMRPAEFAQVVVILFLPALLLAWPIQFWFFRRGGLLRAVHAARVVAAALLMPLGALVLTAMVVLNAPPHWGRWLAVHELDHKAHQSRLDHEYAVLQVLKDAKPDFVILAGYMRLLSSSFIEEWSNRIINIHPSLLPAFPGVDAQKQALEYGVKISGCTVHFVDENLDAGPIILQRAVDVRDDDTPETLSARILEQEHVAYVDALRLLSTHAWRIENRRVLFD